ncbi:hypothetical protein V2I21_01900 [Campylobacter sp. CLAX-22107-21]|uniref:hypothetical protein n=1 Tax=Campylobacter devanensis TaxID=3161138 RepID=UPI002EAFA6B5|nr:hypothetical protein [Campylobacter sp. CLAX-22107-21]
MSTLNAFYVAFDIKSNLKFISTIEGKRQRLIWEFENSGVYGVLNYISIEILSYGNKDHTYIEDSESNKNLKCFHYTIELPAKDGKNRVIGYYFDQYGNIKSKNIKFNLMEKALKAQDIDLEEYFFKGVSLETITTSLGYDLEGLPDSCQKGKGEFFKCIDPFTQMYLLKYGDTIKARCYVWNEGSITFEKENEKITNTNKLADRIYAVDGYWKGEMIKRLKEEGIGLIWSEEQDEIYLDGNYEAYIDMYEIKDIINEHIKKNKVPWLDSFNQYNSDTYRLYLYDWKYCGYTSDENEFIPSLANYAFLMQNGEVKQTVNLVWDCVTGVMIPEDDAVYINFGSSAGYYTSSEYVVWSDYHQGHFLEEDAIEMIVDDRIDYTYEGSGLSLIDIEGRTYLVSELDIYSA